MNSIHPSAVLNGDVALGEGNTIGPFAVINGPVSLGNANWVGTGVVIGAPPEVRSWTHPADAAAPSSGNGIEIGDGNVFREYVQIHQGWKERTVIGNRAFIMNQSYVAHDCRLGDDVTLAASVLLAGHVEVRHHSNLGLGVRVHQGRYIGDGAMIGMGALVTRDVPPFAKAYGSPARVHGANLVGMQRMNMDNSLIERIEHELRTRADGRGLVALTGADSSGALSVWRDHIQPSRDRGTETK